ncbi:hypothetical protein ACHAW5_006340 [Stephanodiscus triporus]|uniref:Uncharacterized protein n=1 Tax=Stephanodiscus triporus TaxID=2934178 RepID=A0ABD3Q1N5_9STRA
MRSASGHRDESSMVELPCPIVLFGRGVGGCGGTFLVEASKLGSGAGRHPEIIDLCRDDEGAVVDDARGVVKRAAKEEEVQRSSSPEAAADLPSEVKREIKEMGMPPLDPPGSRSVAHVKDEEKRPRPEAERSTDPSSPEAAARATSRSQHNHHITEPPPVPWQQEACNLKPLFQVGDEVYAAWWDPKLNVKDGMNASWFPGKVKSHQFRRRVGPSRYGPTRLYHIQYDDGDEQDDLEDYWVCSKRGYELSRKFDDMGWKPIGVTERFDNESNDEWARVVEWYAMNVDGEERMFSYLEDAMTAHDACVIRKHGTQTKRSYLNLPERYPWLFPDESEIKKSEEVSEEDGLGVVRTVIGGSVNVVVSLMLESRSVNNENKTNHNVLEDNVSTTTEIVDIVPLKAPSSTKIEPNAKLEISGKGVASPMDTSNVVSPMSSQSVYFEQNSSNNRADQSDEESRFSEVDESDESEEDMEEWREVKRRRLDFSSKENALNATFWSVNREDIQFTEEAFTTKPLFHLNSFVNGNLKRISAFSVFLREEVATPGFDPLPTTIDIDRIAGWTYSQLVDKIYAGLKDETGEYIGPVYVIGVITKKVVPWSGEERDIAENKMGEFRVATGANHIHNICRVRWRRMGYKKSLMDSTRNYITHVCRPTLMRICGESANVHHQDIRRDLWSNATIHIHCDEFRDRFDYTCLAEDN